MPSGHTRDPRRSLPIVKYQVARFSWASGVTANVTQTIKLNMLIERIDVIISNPTNTVNIDLTVRDENSVIIIVDSILLNLTDNSNHVFLSTKATADFDAIPVHNLMTIVGVINTDPGATGATVDMIFYGP